MEASMQPGIRVVFSGDRDGAEVQVSIAWQPFIAFVKSLLATIVVLLALLSSTAVARIIELLGR
jgi:hypothetical protein